MSTTNVKFFAKNGLDANGNVIANVATPVNTTDAVNKAYVTSQLASFSSGATLSATASEPTLYVGLSSATTGAWTSAKVSSNLVFDASTSTLTASTFNSSSDVRLKDDIKVIPNGLSVIKKLYGVSFTWKETGIPAFGLIAQEVETVIPEIVSSHKTDEFEDQKSVQYDAIIPFLIEAIKEQQTQIDFLKSEIIKGQ